MTPLRTATAALLVALVVASGAPVAAQEAPRSRPGPAPPPGSVAPAAPASGAAASSQTGDEEGGLEVYAYTLEHQRAGEALALVRPLLSPRGTVELQPGGNTLVVRDSLAALTRIGTVLRSFDHPPRPIKVEILVVRASTTQVSPSTAGSAGEVPADLVERLRKLLRYTGFTLLAKADLRILEGEQILYEMGGGYGVRFQLGTLYADDRIKLHGFQVNRGGETEGGRPLLHTNLNLLLDQTVTLALAPQEGSEKALMVVVTCRDAGTGALPVRPPEEQ